VLEGQHFVELQPRLPEAHPAAVVVLCVQDAPLLLPAAPQVTHDVPHAACASASVG